MTDTKFVHRQTLMSCAQVRAQDQFLIEEQGIPGYELMNRAGTASFRHLQHCWPEARHILVICGTGNNGGDGWIVARCALEAGFTVNVALVGDTSRVTGDARTAMETFLAVGPDFHRWTDGRPPQTQDVDVIVDALLGIGPRGALRAPHEAVINEINAWNLPVLSLDAPSGLDADCGQPTPVAVRACHTLTFIGAKKGLYTGQAGDYTGGVTLAALGAEAAEGQGCQADAYLMHRNHLLTTLPRRGVAHHKGRSGHVLIIGGNQGYTGAAILAARAALRAGAGLVSLASRAATVNAAAIAQPEIMARAVDNPQALTAMVAAASVVVIGPGLGQDTWAHMCLASAVERGKRVVFDADALNLLAHHPGSVAEVPDVVYTPHPGEAGRMLNKSTTKINADRFAALAQLIASWQGVHVLKGWGTLVGCAQGPVATCPYGNPAMAVGGMGDVLAGVLGGLMAQGMPSREAAEAGVAIHGLSGDRARAAIGSHGLLPSDLIEQLPSVITEILAGQ